jgi:hypothetical protein
MIASFDKLATSQLDRLVILICDLNKREDCLSRASPASRRSSLPFVPDDLTTRIKHPGPFACDKFKHLVWRQSGILHNAPPFPQRTIPPAVAPIQVSPSEFSRDTPASSAADSA